MSGARPGPSSAGTALPGAGAGAVAGTGAIRTLYLPDFCAPRAVLAVVLIVELTALVLTLARDEDRVGFWTDLARTSLFLLWIGLMIAGLLCALRGRIATTSVARGSATVLGLVALVISLVSEVTWQIGQSALVGPDPIGDLFPRERVAFLLRNVGIGLVVAGVALRYFYVTHEWRRNIEMQAQARVHALQARIRPHFLFNSMNTIASLTRSDPARAEEAVQDLADLFRANLSEQRAQITLADELEVAGIYERIEKLRLGGRLRVEWRTGALPRDAMVPSLLIQPLLENAIYHGIEPRRDGGTVVVSGELAHGLITLVVRNPMPEGAVVRDGNRLALANIRERLTLMYDERATIKAGRFDDEYIVTLRFPYLHAPAATAAA
ncbi:MAG: histidine kinase [Steroidobacteraceae bacterium]|jgi:two-component system sensor histidine kinase AlgZ|nr:histidine kinase [Steroidobacteraceae bacterium]